MSWSLGEDNSALIATFFDHYLQLDEQEEEQFRNEFSKISPEEKNEMLKYTTSWHEAGRKEERELREQAERERDAERQRAELAEREAHRLAARLRELGIDPDSLTD